MTIDFTMVKTIKIGSIFNNIAKSAQKIHY